MVIYRYNLIKILQGRVKFPTGGDSPRALKRAGSFDHVFDEIVSDRFKVSRFGEIPKPTV